MRAFVCHVKFLRRIAATAFTCGTFTCGTLLLSSASMAESSIAESLGRVRNDAFYHQLIKLPQSDGYLPTRSFTIIVDTQRGNQLVAADDPNLRFNMLWMDQLKPGYRTRSGGAAFGTLFRSYVKNAYNAFRANNSHSTLAGESLDNDEAIISFTDAMDYQLKVSGDEVRLKLEYTY